MIERNRQESRQRVITMLDPFGQGEEAIRLQARGLTNLYYQMARPSSQYIEQVVTDLAALSYDQLRTLDWATSDAGYNTQSFFRRYGLSITDPQLLEQGIQNSSVVFEYVSRQFDVFSGELDETFNAHQTTEAILEEMEVAAGQKRLAEEAGLVKAEVDLSKRYDKGLLLKGNILHFLNSHQFSLRDVHRLDQSYPITWEGVTTQAENRDIALKTNYSERRGFYPLIQQAAIAQAAVTRPAFEQRLAHIPRKDQARFATLRHEYGAKAANLLLLSEKLEALNQVRGEGENILETKLSIPEFQTVPVDLYRKFVAGTLQDSDLAGYYEWANQLTGEERGYSHPLTKADYIIRSSAVFSEDGEYATGAGIYESVVVLGDSSFAEFKEAVHTVYDSTTSQRAEQYRQELGIPTEEMGLIIQKYVTPVHNRYLSSLSSPGYMNTRLTGVPSLMEIVTQESRNFIKRDEIDFFLPLDAHSYERTLQTAHQFPVDQKKIRPQIPLRLAQLGLVAERLWGREVQIEFVADLNDIHIVQIRELPDSAVGVETAVQFPDVKPLHSGAAIGVGDRELPVLSNQADNSQRSGVVVFSDNYLWSVGDKTYHLPKDGAVVISRLDGQNGHIQTICAERGLLCVYPDLNETADQPKLDYHDLSSLESMRVVANGIEGRIYRLESNSMEQE